MTNDSIECVAGLSLVFGRPSGKVSDTRRVWVSDGCFAGHIGIEFFLRNLKMHSKKILIVTKERYLVAFSNFADIS